MTDHYRKLVTVFDEVGIHTCGELIPDEVHIIVEKNKERVVFRFNRKTPKDFIDWHYENENENENHGNEIHQIQVRVYEAEAVLLYVQAELKEAQAKELAEHKARGKPR